MSWRAVAVVGAGDCTEAERSLAYEVGRLLALRGVAVVCGGLGGVMEAACQGCFEAGGMTVGLLPGSSVADANAYVRVPIATGMGEMRNLLVVRSAEALIAVGGEYGTLSEIAFALKTGKRVVGVGTWSLVRGGVEDEGVLRAGSAEEAVEMALG